MAELLVSVRSADEAQAALDGGATIIDVKEPALGSLGRASTETTIAVVKRVAGRAPVSAALGELGEMRGLAGTTEQLCLSGISYLKWGLGESSPGWQRILIDTARKLAIPNPGCLPVAVAYADWQQARSPSVDAVCAFVGLTPPSSREAV